MDNQKYGIRVTGDYATYQGNEYFATDAGDRIWLFSDDDPLPPGFEPSPYDWVRGEKLVPMSDIQRLFRVQTHCRWRGHPFSVGIIVDDLANAEYLGLDFDSVYHLPGMTRPDKFEVIGKIPVTELTDLSERIEEVPLDARSDEASGRQAK
jgi:hypothetical protein